MMQMMPLFLENPDWYITPPVGEDSFEDGRGYHLAQGVPEEVRESYEAFYAPRYDLQGRSTDPDEA